MIKKYEKFKESFFGWTVVDVKPVNSFILEKDNKRKVISLSTDVYGQLYIYSEEELNNNDGVK